MGPIKTVFAAVISAIFLLSTPMRTAHADSGDVLVGVLLGGALGSVITNDYYNRGHYDRYYDRYYYDDVPVARRWREYRGRRAFARPESSEAVRVQQALSANGYYSGRFNGNLDSYESRSAIMQYQQRYGLPTTGVLQQEVKSLLIYQGEVAVLSNYLNYLGYERRDKGRRLQAALKVMGFYTSSIDGLIGRKSQDAVRLYQQSEGMVVSGALMPAEEDLLVSEAKEKLQQQRKQAEEQLAQIGDRNK